MEEGNRWLRNNWKVGIGTDDPILPLHISSTNPAIRLTDENQATDNKNWNIGAGTSQILRIQAINDAGGGGGNLFDFYRVDNNVNELRGMKSGNYWFVVDNLNTKVGIGTSSPNAKLDVNVGSSVTAFNIEGTEGQLFSVTNNLSSGSIFAVNDISGTPSINVDADGTIQLAPFLANDKIGIGTTNPQSN